MGDYISIEATDGSGSFNAYVVKPESGSGPVIIALQEIFGVNAGMRSICDDLAEEGYIAICPDLFWRMKPGVDITDQSEEEWQEAFGYFNSFDHAKGMEDIAATVSAARTIDGGNGKVGAVGYCLGGLLAVKTAIETDVDAAVSYYGVGLDQQVAHKDKIDNPLMMHIAEADEFVSPEIQAAIKAGFADKANVTIHSYAGMDHAFARPNGIHWNAEAAKLANDRTNAFFIAHLKEA